MSPGIAPSSRPVDDDLIVVDGANVVGSVPDGWWRDRAGAAARLHAALVTAASAWGGASDPVVESELVESEVVKAVVVELVLEGQARPGVAAGVVGGVRTVHAAGEGDDEIVARCREHVGAGRRVAVVTADRGLIARVAPLGVRVLGPRSLRAAIGHT